LTPDEKLRIIQDMEDPWQILSHPLLLRVFKAENELAEVFIRFSATAEDRRKVIRLFLKWPPIPSSKRRAVRWFTDKLAYEADKKYQLAQRAASAAALGKATVGSAPIVLELALPLYKRVQQFCKTLGHLSRNQQREVARLIVDLDRRYLLNAEKAMSLLSDYKDTDHDAYIEQLYHSLMVSEAVIVGKPISPTIEVSLPPAESAIDLLRRMRDNPVSYTDITQLRRLYHQREIPQELMKEYLTHIICFRMTHDGRKRKDHAGRGYKILRTRVVKKYAPPQYQALGEEVLAQLIREGHIVKRDKSERVPGLQDPVKLSGPMKAKYQWAAAA
jgi:hypothetical protein